MNGGKCAAQKIFFDVITLTLTRKMNFIIFSACDNERQRDIPFQEGKKSFLLA
jgi:hypothetical protein